MTKEKRTTRQKNSLTEETKEHKDAFNLYLEMEKRSYAKVAKKIGRDARVVARWGSAFDWQGRVKAIDDEASERAQMMTKARYFAKAENLQELKYDALDKLKHMLENAHAYQLGVSDVVKILDCVKTELGEPTSITKGSVNVDKQNPFADIVERLLPGNGKKQD